MNQPCLNCGHQVKGNFCTQCGQSKKVERFTFTYLLSEFLYSFTSTDRSVWALLKSFFRNPGLVAYEYIDLGKRKKYFNLFTFFLIVLGFSALFENKVWHLREDMFQLKNYYGYYFNLYKKMMILFMVPFNAFCIWLIYFKTKKYLFSEYLVFVIILMTVKSFIDIGLFVITFLIIKITGKNVELDSNLMYPFILILIMCWVVYHFHKGAGIRDKARSIASGFSFVAVEVLIVLFIVWAFFQRFHGLGIFDMFGVRISQG